jgi:hypothetical protein
MGGRWIGYPQLVVAIVGLVLFNIWLVVWMLACWREGMITLQHDAVFWAGMGGLSLLAADWIWALLTSLSILSEIKRRTNPA